MKILNKICGTIIKCEENVIFTSFSISKKWQSLLNDLKNNEKSNQFGELVPYDTVYNLAHVSHTVEILNETSDDDFIYVDIKLRILNTWYGKQLKELVENRIEIIPTIYHIQIVNIQQFNVNLNLNQVIPKFW